MKGLKRFSLTSVLLFTFLTFACSIDIAGINAKNSNSEYNKVTPVSLVSSNSSFYRPTNSNSILTSSYRWRDGYFHYGVDLGYTYNIPTAERKIYASAAGKVIFSGTASSSNYGSGYGNLIVIDHGNGYQSRYGHLSSTKVVLLSRYWK